MLDEPPREAAGEPQRTSWHAVKVRIIGFLPRRHLGFRPRQHEAVELPRLQLPWEIRIAAVPPHARQIHGPVSELRYRTVGVGLGDRGAILAPQPSTQLLRPERRGEPNHDD